ncbi:glycosyltransferase family 4 protein [Hydrogenimonas sp.]
MTILFIRQHHTPFGGAERYLSRLNEALRAKGYRTKVIHAELPKWLPSWLKALLFDRQVCKRKIHSNDKRQTTELYFSLDRIGCPDIYRAGDGVHKAFLKTKGFSLNPLHLTYLRLEKRTFENARLIIANSRMVKEQILEHYPQVPSDKIVVVYNGVPIPPTPDKPAAKRELAKEFDIDENLPIILFVGSGFRRKGVEEFLQTLSRLQNPFHAFVVGKEKRMKRYIELARALGIRERVTFTGPRKDVEPFYAAADIFLFPTRYEPFSNVVLEAMSHGCATFTTRQNGAHEILPESFVMKAPNDPLAVERIDSLLHDGSSLHNAQEEARSIAERFSIDRNVNETLKALEPFLKGDRA